MTIQQFITDIILDFSDAKMVARRLATWGHELESSNVRKISFHCRKLLPVWVKDEGLKESHSSLQATLRNVP
jgi:hypothetical protein